MALAILERLKSRRREAEHRKTQTREQLIQRVADDQATEQEIETALQELSMTEDELQDAVVMLMKRVDWQTQVDELPALQVAANEIEAALKQLVLDADREVMAVRQRQKIGAAELNRQLAIISGKTQLANEAVTSLHKTKPPEVKAAELQLSKQIRALMNERNAITEDMAFVRDVRHGSPLGRGVRYAANERRVAEIDAEITALQDAAR